MVLGRHVTVTLKHKRCVTKVKSVRRLCLSYPDQKLCDGQVTERRRQVERCPRVAAAHRGVHVLGLAVGQGEAHLKTKY